MRFAGVAVGVCIANAGAGSIVVVLPASADNTMYSEHDTFSNGQGPGIFVGTTATANFRRAVIRFDVSAVPSSARIVDASLTLHMSKTAGGPAPVSLHPALAEWGEGASNAGEPGGAGTPAMPGDATWAFRLYDTQRWTSAGGDFATTPSATTTIDQPNTYTWSSPGLTADVRAWVGRPETNLGWVLVGDETKVFTAKRFDSRQSVSVDDRPRLMVEYECVADVDRNGFVTADDMDSFVGFFAAGEARADLDGNGFVTADDFDAFVVAFLAGC